MSEKDKKEEKKDNNSFFSNLQTCTIVKPTKNAIIQFLQIGKINMSFSFLLKEIYTFIQ
jgi:hypothetical protein